MLARTIYELTEWSGCNGSRWERLSEDNRDERIAKAEKIITALRPDGCESIDDLVERWRCRAADTEQNHWMAAYMLRFCADELDYIIRDSVVIPQWTDNPMLRVIGVLVKKAQSPPPESSPSVQLGWRTGYQNAMADLIAELFPDLPGGVRLSIEQLIAEDDRRGDGSLRDN